MHRRTCLFMCWSGSQYSLYVCVRTAVNIFLCVLKYTHIRTLLYLASFFSLFIFDCLPNKQMIWQGKVHQRTARSIFSKIDIFVAVHQDGPYERNNNNNNNNLLDPDFTLKELSFRWKPTFPFWSTTFELDRKLPSVRHGPPFPIICAMKIDWVCEKRI